MSYVLHISEIFEESILQACKTSSCMCHDGIIFINAACNSLRIHTKTECNTGFAQSEKRVQYCYFFSCSFFYESSLQAR